MDQHMKVGRWHKINGRSLNECVVGIIGVGNIGREVMKKLRPFGCKIRGMAPVAPPAEFIAEVGCEMTTLDEVLTKSDFVCTCCQLTAETEHLMNAEAFAKMMPTAYLINTARGPIVHEIALTDALQAGRLAGCALDVFEFEPLPVDSPLRSMDNVRECSVSPICEPALVAFQTRRAHPPGALLPILQVLIAPHNSNSSPTAHENVQWNTIRNLMTGLGIPYEDYDAEI
jgi:phosphoglycerate dehydrogenase-like enzyme